MQNFPRAVFTDEDFKRFKMAVNGRGVFTITEEHISKLRAFIARVEASEALCNQAEHYRWAGMSQFLDAWHKACGR